MTSMDIAIPIRTVPDPVEELDPDPDGTDIDREWTEFVLNEFDEHAIEEAVLLKERRDEGDTITVIAIDDGLADVEQMLYTAAAKGVDRLIRIDNVPTGISTNEAASLFADVLHDEEFDAVFTGVQSAEDRDGQLAGMLGHDIDLPHISVITEVVVEDGQLVVEKEFAGGVTANYAVDTPAVLGIQAASEPPRYVPVSQIRRAMRGADIEAIDADSLDSGAAPGSEVTSLHEPERGEEAAMLSGSPEETAGEIVEILADNGIEV